MKEILANSPAPTKPGRPNPKAMAAAWVRQTVRRIEKPSADREEDLHLVRGNIKRLRAIMWMIRPVIGERFFRRENHRLRSLAHSLSGPRDQDVGCQTLEKLARSVKKQKERTAFKRVLELYEAANRPDEREQERLEDAMRAAARALRFSGARIQRLPIDPEDWRTIGPGFQRVYRSGRRRKKKAIADEEDASYHRWRIRVRNLSDQLDCLAPLWPSRLGRIRSKLNKLKSKLGADHDLVILRAALRKISIKFSDADAAECVLARMKKRSRKLRSASRKLGKSSFCEAPGRFLDRLENHWRDRRAASAKIAPGDDREN
jgi:CHAD domain-containing protein